MGLGAGTIELYRQLKITGALDGITEVMELGSQDYWCPQDNLMRALFKSFGADAPLEVFGATPQQQKPAQLVYEALGIKYKCVDVDGRDGTLVMDLNFDTVPEDQLSRYGLVTNHGTTEHLMNQSNAFQVVHDFTKPGGLMLHAVPFMGYVEHGFFSYHPNLFQALARYNSYEIVGMWIGPTMFAPQLVPWDISILDALALTPRSAVLLVVVLRKISNAQFFCPFQGVYEESAPDRVLTRYCMTVDGEVMDANRVRHLIRRGEIKEAWAPPEIKEAWAPPSGTYALLRQSAGKELVQELVFRVQRRLKLFFRKSK